MALASAGVAGSQPIIRINAHKALHQFGISMGTLALCIIEAVLKTDTHGRGSHADGTGEHREVTHRVMGDTPAAARFHQGTEHGEITSRR